MRCGWNNLLELSATSPADILEGCASINVYISRKKTYFGNTYFEMCRYLFEVGKRDGTEVRTIWHSSVNTIRQLH